MHDMDLSPMNVLHPCGDTLIIDSVLGEDDSSNNGLCRNLMTSIHAQSTPLIPHVEMGVFLVWEVIGSGSIRPGPLLGTVKASSADPCAINLSSW